jgi:hypothetical protein
LLFASFFCFSTFGDGLFSILRCESITITGRALAGVAGGANKPAYRQVRTDPLLLSLLPGYEVLNDKPPQPDRNRPTSSRAILDRSLARNLRTGAKGKGGAQESCMPPLYISRAVNKIQHC